MDFKRDSLKKIIAIMFIIFIVILFAVSCGQGETGESNAEIDTIKMMTVYYGGDPMPNDSELLKIVKEYTGVQLEVEWVLDAAYEENFNIVLASGDMPQVILVKDKYASFIKACDVGAFWELGPYLKDYPNLKDMNPIVLNNISIHGKVYSIYRERELGRNGVVYRSDWLKNVGLEPPKTTDDFYNMLYKFTYDDPDGNGKDDTYGMVVCSWEGPFLSTTIWFGAPNEWGEDKNGNLVPAHYTDEFLEAMNFWRKMWEEGLINEDFPVYNCGDWRKPIIAGDAGVIADVLDEARRWENEFIKAGIDAEVDMVGPINGRSRPTSGYNGMYAIPKDSVKTEAELRAILAFLDKLNDPEIQDLLAWGIEGRHWLETDDGCVDIQPVLDDPSLKDEFNGSNQIAMNINGYRAKTLVLTEVRQKLRETLKDNIQYCVPNPAEPLVSETYTEKGGVLDQMIKDGYYKYIVGQIDLDGWKQVLADWAAAGGTDVITEYNEAYREAKQ